MVLPGGTITYTLTVTNNGPDTAAGATLTDTLPAGATFVSFTVFEPATVSVLGEGQTGTITADATTPLAPGASAVFTLVVQVAPGTVPGPITNTAVFGPATYDVNPANNTVASTTVLIGPGGTINTDRPIFTWLPVTGAIGYTIYVADQTSPSTPGLLITGLSGTSYQLTTAQALTPGHAYLWYLGSVKGGSTMYGNPTSFTIAALAAPTAISPVNTTLLPASGYDTPTFSWSSVAAANHYWLYVVDATTGSVVVNNNTISGTSFTPGTSQSLTPGHSYTWYIAAVSTNGAGVSFSGPQNFSLAGLAAPMQNGPSGAIAAANGYDTPTFSWNSVTGASLYWLYVVDATTGAVVVNNAKITATSFTDSAGLTPGHSFTWYIAAEGANGGGASFSGPQSFSLAALTAPVQNGPGGTIAASAGYDTPTFSWSSVAGANRYWLYVQDASSNDRVVINNNTVSGTSFTPSMSQALIPGDTYIWYVAAVSTNGGGVSFSAAKTFTLASVQLGPSNNVTIPLTAGYLTPTFTWVAATAAVSYNVYLIDLTNNRLISNTNVGNATTYTSPTLTAGHRYQWYIGINTSSGTFWDGPETFTLAP